jgi:hypothetical protein
MSFLRKILFLSSLFLVSVSVAQEIEIKWEKPIELGHGVYARVHQISDGRLMAAYSRSGNLMVQFASPSNLYDWSEAKVIAKAFAATNDAGVVQVNLDNAEFAQLETGRIIYACNLRPRGWRHDIYPCAIAITVSDDMGESWSPIEVVYAPKISIPADGAPHGCYEPFVLPLKGNRVQIYFADETPYEQAKCAWQNISYIESDDGGKTWGKQKIACYTPQRRDGMPVVMVLDRWRYLAIEANPGNSKLHPQIVKSSANEGWNDVFRFEPITDVDSWTKKYGGAPYIAATDNFVLLSWQEEFKACVAAISKNEIRPDGSFPVMRYISTPPGYTGVREGLQWNSLCLLSKDRFLFVTSNKGRIKIFPGKVKNKER